MGKPPFYSHGSLFGSAPNSIENILIDFFSNKIERTNTNIFLTRNIFFRVGQIQTYSSGEISFKELDKYKYIPHEKYLLKSWSKVGAS